MKICRDFAPLGFYILFNRFCRTFADLCSIRKIHTAHTGLCRKFDEIGALCLCTVVPHPAGKFQSRFSFRRCVMQAGQSCTTNQIAAVGAAHREEVSSQTVAIGDRTSLIQNHRVYVAAGFNCLTGHSDDVETSHTVHTSDANGGQQTADGGRNQANSQGNQCRGLQLYPGVDADRIQRDNYDHENNGQGNQQGIQCNLVRRFLTRSAFYKCNHTIQEAVAWFRSDADFQPV